MKTYYVDFLITPDGVKHGYPEDYQFDMPEEAIGDAKEWLATIKGPRPTGEGSGDLERRQRVWDACREDNMHNTVKILIIKISHTVETEITV